MLTVDCISIEEDFITWKDQFWPSMCEKFGIAAVGEDIWYVSVFMLLNYFLQLVEVELAIGVVVSEFVLLYFKFRTDDFTLMIMMIPTM